jgi:riboflavin synthase
VAEVVAVRPEGDSTRVTLRAPEALARFIAPKGSVALDGISLTVNEVEGSTFGVNLIPHTKEVTTWGGLQVGQPVNLEVDTMARYVARLREWA